MTRPKRTKMRADQALVERGLVESRSRAQALILAGKVMLGDKRLDKAGHPVAEDQLLTLKGRDHPWVSRGGLKLVGGIEHFKIDFTGLTVIDVGASTGGFTDVALAHGAAKVYAVDVGHGQLAWKLRQNPNVIVLEKTNARHLDAALIPEKVDAIVCDASFISLRTILPAPMALVRPGGFLLALIKPQFEVGRAQVGKGGVVRDPALQDAVCTEISHWIDGQLDWQQAGICPSPILGPQGNKEFLILAHKKSSTKTETVDGR